MGMRLRFFIFAMKWVVTQHFNTATRQVECGYIRRNALASESFGKGRAGVRVANTGLAVVRHDEILSFHNHFNGTIMLARVVSANGIAIRSTPDESPADGRTIFINATAHARAIQSNAPPILTVCHHVTTFWMLRDEVSRNIVSGLQKNHEATAHRITGRAMHLAFRRSSRHEPWLPSG